MKTYRVHGERGILGGGAHEDDEPLLDEWQQQILLRLVEAMDFVEKEDGGERSETELVLGAYGDGLHFGGTRRAAGERHKGTARSLGDDRCDSGLPTARGTTQNNRVRWVALQQDANR